MTHARAQGELPAPNSSPVVSGKRGWAGLAALAIGAAVLSGCNSAFYQHRDDLERMFASGRFDVAARALDEPQTKSMYGEKNRLLYWLDRGSVALATDDHTTAIELFERAEAHMELAGKPGAGDELARWIINDTAASYFGEAYEDVYVNVFKLLAQLERGEVQGGATVEARRAAGKADVLRDRYLRLRRTVSERDPSARDALERGTGGLAQVNDQGEFIESTLGTFLTAVTFMKSGDRDLQSVAGRRLTSSIDLQRGMQAGVSSAAFADLGERDASSVNVLVVGLSGRGPTKQAQTVGPIPIFEYPLYFQLPELVGGSEEVADARLAVEAGGTYPMVKVEDLRAVAIENHRRELPMIYARTLLRATGKSAAIYFGSKSIQRGSKRGDTRDAVQIATILGGIAAMMLTEEADLRCWQFLPARADAVLTKLPAGRHRVRVEYLGSGGGLLYAGPWREVMVGEGAGALSTVVEHYWR